MQTLIAVLGASVVFPDLPVVAVGDRLVHEMTTTDTPGEWVPRQFGGSTGPDPFYGQEIASISEIDGDLNFTVTFTDETSLLIRSDSVFQVQRGVKVITSVTVAYDDGSTDVLPN